MATLSDDVRRMGIAPSHLNMLCNIPSSETRCFLPQLFAFSLEYVSCFEQCSLGSCLPRKVIHSQRLALFLITRLAFASPWRLNKATVVTKFDVHTDGGTNLPLYMDSPCGTVYLYGRLSWRHGLSKKEFIPSDLAITPHLLFTLTSQKFR